MKMTISSRELLKQLPPNVRLWIIGADDIPDKFTLEVDVSTLGLNAHDKEQEEIKRKYTDAYNVLGPISWRVFREIARPGGVTGGTLVSLVGGSRSRNTLSVALYTLRKTFDKHELPYIIKHTSRRGYDRVFSLSRKP